MKPIPELDNETLANRKAAMELTRLAAQRGDGIAGALFELESAADKLPGGGIAQTLDYRDEDEDDDERPY